MNKKELDKTLADHKLWLSDITKGKRADLRDADLRYAELQGADLRNANLQYADLQYADLQCADLRGANLQGADLYGAYLRGADLQDADLRGADLRGANLQGVDLQCVDLQCVDLQGANLQGAKLPDQIINQPKEAQMKPGRLFKHNDGTTWLSTSSEFVCLDGDKRGSKLFASTNMQPFIGEITIKVHRFENGNIYCHMPTGDMYMYSMGKLVSIDEKDAGQIYSDEGFGGDGDEFEYVGKFGGFKVKE